MPSFSFIVTDVLAFSIVFDFDSFQILVDWIYKNFQVESTFSLQKEEKIKDLKQKIADRKIKNPLYDSQMRLRAGNAEGTNAVIAWLLVLHTSLYWSLFLAPNKPFNHFIVKLNKGGAEEFPNPLSRYNNIKL